LHCRILERLLIARSGSLWDKYAVGSLQLEREREQTLAHLNEFLENWVICPKQPEAKDEPKKVIGNHEIPGKTRNIDAMSLLQNECGWRGSQPSNCAKAFFLEGRVPPRPFVGAFCTPPTAFSRQQGPLLLSPTRFRVNKAALCSNPLTSAPPENGAGAPFYIFARSALECGGNERSEATPPFLPPITSKARQRRSSVFARSSGFSLPSISYHNAKRGVDFWVEQGLLQEATGQKRNRMFVANDILGLMAEHSPPLNAQPPNTDGAEHA
jgi:hypothetical protein